MCTANQAARSKPYCGTMKNGSVVMRHHLAAADVHDAHVHAVLRADQNVSRGRPQSGQDDLVEDLRRNLPYFRQFGLCHRAPSN